MDLSRSEQVTRQTFVDAVVALYDTAQINVLGRAGALAQRQLRRMRATQFDLEPVSNQVAPKGTTLAERSGESGPPILAEDLLLLLSRPNPATGGSGVISGASTLIYVLAGAVLADLRLGGDVRTVPGWAGSTRLEAVADALQATR